MKTQKKLEEIRIVKRTELYNSILSIVKQIPRKEVQDDAMDAPSCTYELEQLFLKFQQERIYSEEDLKQFAFECVGNFLSNRENELEIELVNVISDRNNKLFEKFKNK